MVKTSEKKTRQVAEILSDALVSVAGGTDNSITLFKLECPCGWISDTVAGLSEIRRCPVCGRHAADGFVKYAYVCGEWIRIDPN